MLGLIKQIQIKVNEKIYVKDPESSELGKNIIKHGIELIDELGFEAFTFKKLSERMHSTESSIYRYFDNKHRFLIYILSWYWGLLEYKLVFETTNLSSTKKKLERGIRIIVDLPKEEETYLKYIPLKRLHNILINESAKAYLTKEVDADNKEGFFLGYKRICRRIGDIILEIKPNYKFPNILAATVIEGINHHKYFAKHLPSLADSITEEKTVMKFYVDMILSVIKSNTNDNK